MSKPTLADAYRLLHDGALALAEVERAGMRIDVPLLDRTIAEVGGQIDALEASMRADPLWTAWRKRYGERAKITSRQQLAAMLEDELKEAGAGKTRTGRAKVDGDALEGIKLKFVRDFLDVERLRKLRSTNLMGIKRELVGEWLRPSFNLHLVKTYRSSCDRPNSQNFPKRNEGSAKMIRRLFIPRDGHVIVEHDFSALEFKICACFFSDPAMQAYASDPKLDVHRDMAGECYLLDPSDVPGKVRFFAKNQFVFPTLYGSYWRSTARGLWSVVPGLELNDGTPLAEHLREKGFRRLGDSRPGEGPKSGTFEHHVREVEQAFCDRFPVWAERKEKWWSRYEARGWFPLMTGFRCSGAYTRNQLYNTPVQGPAFHCLLWSLIRMVRWLRETGKRSRIIGQIHDSLIGDVHRDELDEYLARARRTMTEDIRGAWPWITVPLDVEAEVGENWYDKEKVK